MLTTLKNLFVVRVHFAKKNMTILNVLTEKLRIWIDKRMNERKTREAIPCEIRPAHRQVALVQVIVHLHGTVKDFILTRSFYLFSEQTIEQMIPLPVFFCAIKTRLYFSPCFCCSLAHLVYITWMMCLDCIEIKEKIRV